MIRVAISRPLDIVLDTNVVLDWLVFRDSSVAYLDTALASNAIRVFSCARSTGELKRVLSYPTLALDAELQKEALARYESNTLLVDGSAVLPLAGKLPRCRDPDDQYLLTLAFSTRAHALVSRDKELLRVAKQAKKLGLNVMDVPQLCALLHTHQETQ